MQASLAQTRALDPNGNRCGERSELRRYLEELLSAHREVIELVDVALKSVKEASEIIGLPQATIKTRLFYARKALVDVFKYQAADCRGVGHGVADASMSCLRTEPVRSRGPGATTAGKATAAPAIFDIIRLRSGASVAFRSVDPNDCEALQDYFRTLSPGARRNRFVGASNGPSDRELERLDRDGKDERFGLVAVMIVNGAATIIGEACCTFDRTAGGCEFGLSVRDEYQGHGIGSVLLSTVERFAASLGARSIFGNTLSANAPMQALARKAGFSLSNTPGDWSERRMAKSCVSAFRIAGEADRCQAAA